MKEHNALEKWVGEDDNGEPIYMDVPCGTWHGGDVAYCAEHIAKNLERYPQGWAHYAGDTCQHGVYVGGSGIDYMCHYCEMGYDTWVPDSTYELFMSIADGAPMDVPALAHWMDSSMEAKADMVRDFFLNPVWSTPEFLALNPEWWVKETATGYWAEAA